MEKRLRLLIIIIMLGVSLTWIYPQEAIPYGKVEVLALKGSVVFNGAKLKKGDRIEFQPNINPMNQLVFSNATDWIKVMEIGSRKVYNYYMQKKYACNNCLFTRGVYLDNTAKIDLYNYFSRTPIFLFEPDTIIPLRKNFSSNINNIVLFQIILNEKIYERAVGNSDTIIISHDRLFGFADEESILWPSFQTDSLRLFYYNNDTQMRTIPDVPYFHVYFIDDAVQFFLNMDMSCEEIYNELKENYIDLKYLAVSKNFENLDVTEEWVLGYIETLISKSVK